MKKLLILLLLLNSVSAITQTIKETAQAFWEANYSGNNAIIVEKGEQLIVYIDQNKVEIDSTILEIRLITANGHSYL